MHAWASSPHDSGCPVGEDMSRLINMARHGLVWYEKRSDKRCFRLVPFGVGIYESQLENMPSLTLTNAWGVEPALSGARCTRLRSKALAHCGQHFG